MGKSTTAAMFAAEGVPVWDADATVHRLYDRGGAGAAAIASLCPEAVPDGAVDRDRLKAWIAATPGALARIEAAVHPLVAEDRAQFIRAATEDGAPIVLLDIPLLFETDAESALDATVVVTAPAAVQRARVLARPGMTEAQFEAIRARQMPDAEKRRRATWVIRTPSLEHARAAVRDILAKIGKANA